MAAMRTTTEADLVETIAGIEAEFFAWCRETNEPRHLATLLVRALRDDPLRPAAVSLLTALHGRSPRGQA